MAFIECAWSMKWIIVLNIFCNNWVPTISLMTQDLGGTWNVQNAEKGYDLSATVPGGIYSDLMRSNIINDVFYGFNDLETRWVSKINWNYSRSFVIESELLAHDNINLVFDGVDTFSKILVNNVVVGYTENMFVRYIFDVKPYLQLGKNTIAVQFQSPVETARLLFEKQAKQYVVPPECVPSEFNGECHVNHIRKMQASFAWDWGPAFPSVGIWKKVYLEAYNSSVIRDVTVSIYSNEIDNHWDIQLNTYLAENLKSTSIQGTFLIEIFTDIEKITSIYKINVKKNKKGDFLVTKNLTVPKTYVELWWPNGYGDAKLYTVNVSFISPNKTERSIKTLRIGFRTVELVQNAIENGRTFYFKINGVPIFAKGANSIPISILPEAGQNESTVRFLLQSAKKVNMNMLRVWGGGVYESDMYYELTDELGILIWQDFMFACSMYPTNVEFLKTVRNEVKHQVRRLQHHPSVVLWAGNNENEAALRQNWYGTSMNFSLYRQDYIKLYVNTIKEELLLNDNTRPYLTSSPTNGVQSDQEDHVAENPQSHFYGDVHYYNYVVDGWETSIYPISRFASEFGYQSLPSLDTWLTATNNISDLMINSPFFRSRQHHLFGYGEMQTLIDFQLLLPSEISKHFRAAYIFYSQIIQAMSIKIETEYYRQWRSNLNEEGEGLTMGALYWQLNDVWVAPSWASIDFKNNWKMLHYYAKNFFAPVIVTGSIYKKNQLNVSVVSDLTKPIHGAVVYIYTFRWDSFDPVNEHKLNIDILPGVSQQIVNTYPYKKNMSTNCFIYLTVKDTKSETIIPDNYVFPIPLKWASLQRPVLKISNVTQTDGTAKQFSVQIETNKITLFVWLEVKGIQGHFSDNGFLQVTPMKTIYFYAEQPITVNQLQNSLHITNLLDKKYTHHTLQES